MKRLLVVVLLSVHTYAMEDVFNRKETDNLRVATQQLQPGCWQQLPQELITKILFFAAKDESVVDVIKNLFRLREVDTSLNILAQDDHLIQELIQSYAIPKPQKKSSENQDSGPTSYRRFKHWPEDEDGPEQKRIRDLFILAPGTKKNLKPIIEELLESGLLGNLEDFESHYSLLNAATFGHRQIVELLVKHGVNVNGRDENQFTPLLLAGQYHFPEIALFLLDHGASTDFRDKDNANLITWAINQCLYGFVKLLFYYQFEQALLLGEKIENKALVNMLVFQSGPSALIYAASCGRAEVIKILLEHGVNVNAQDQEGNTALIYAAFHRQIEMVKLLLSHEADVNIKNKRGNDALREVTLYCKDITSMLVEAGAYNLTAYLTFNSDNLDIGIVKKMITNGADINEPDQYGNTAIMITSNLEVLQFLIDLGANVNAKGERGYTVLASAAEYDEKATVEFLLAHGADVNIANDAGQTPLSIAQEKGFSEIAALIEQHLNA